MQQIKHLFTSTVSFKCNAKCESNEDHVRRQSQKTRIKLRGNLKQLEDQTESYEDHVWRQSQTTWTSNWEERGSRVKTNFMNKNDQTESEPDFSTCFFRCVMRVYVCHACVFEMPCNIWNSKTSGRKCNFGHSSHQLLRWTLLLINCSDQHCS